MRIPVRVRRPAATRKALGLSPLLEAGGADSSRVERVPLMSAGASPDVFLVWRPAAERRSGCEGRTGRGSSLAEAPDPKTTDDLAGASERAHMPHSGLSSCRLTHRASELGLRFIECSPPVPPPEQPARAWLCTAPDASGRGQTESSPPSRRDRFGISCSSRTGARRTRGLPAQPEYYLPRRVSRQARGDEKSPLCFRRYGSYPCSGVHHTADRFSVFGFLV